MASSVPTSFRVPTRAGNTSPAAIHAQRIVDGELVCQRGVGHVRRAGPVQRMGGSRATDGKLGFEAEAAEHLRCAQESMPQVLEMFW